MEISNDKISELLKNPQVVGMIASLASGFTQNTPKKSVQIDNPEDNETFEDKPQEQTVLALKDDAKETVADIPYGISPSSAPYSDRRIALLEAIKPYISDTKKDKVDSLVKAIGVAGILNTYTGGDFLGIFGKK